METQELTHQMIQKIIDDETASAQDDFSIVMSTKLTSALDARKQELAQRIYDKQEVSLKDNGTEETTDSPV